MAFKDVELTLLYIYRQREERESEREREDVKHLQSNQPLDFNII